MRRRKPPRHPLALAARAGDGAELARLLRESPTTQEAEDALLMASTRNHFECARLLLESGVCADASDQFRDALGHSLSQADEDAQESGRADFSVSGLLIAHGAHLQCGNDRPWSRLHEVAFQHEVHAFRFLLDKGAEPEIREDGSTLLHSTCWQCEHDRDYWNEAGAEILQIVVDLGIPLEARDREGRTALHEAAGSDGFQYTAARKLWALGAEVDALDDYGQTPLHLVAQRYNPTGVQILLDAGANPLLPDNDGKTPHDLAAEVVSTGTGNYPEFLVAARDVLTRIESRLAVE